MQAKASMILMNALQPQQNNTFYVTCTVTYLGSEVATGIFLS